jgi:hypothetical protein
MGVLSTKLDELAAEIDAAVGKVDGQVTPLETNLRTFAPAIVGKFRGIGAQIESIKNDLGKGISQIEAELDKLVR